MPACLLVAPCTRWQETARGTAETLWERRQVGLSGEALAQEDCMGFLLLGGCGQGAPLGSMDPAGRREINGHLYQKE